MFWDTETYSSIESFKQYNFSFRILECFSIFSTFPFVPEPDLASELVTIPQSLVCAKKSTESEFSSEQGVAFMKLHFAAILFAKLTPSFCLSLSEEINGK